MCKRCICYIEQIASNNHRRRRGTENAMDYKMKSINIKTCSEYSGCWVWDTQIFPVSEIEQELYGEKC